jgi:hypothetical protein
MFDGGVEECRSADREKRSRLQRPAISEEVIGDESDNTQ